MKESTIKKYLEISNDIINSGKTIYSYFEDKSQRDGFYATCKKIIEDTDDRSELAQQLYTNIQVIKGHKHISELDTSDRAEIWYERNEDNKILYYGYKIYRKNKRPLVGSLSREEMVNVYRLYSVYGDNLNARSVSRYFPDLSVVDFKRILSAFSIYKSSSPFPPHYYEEYTEEELRDIQLQERENSFLRKAEEDRIKDNEKLLRKYAKENTALKEQINRVSSVDFNFPNVTPFELPVLEEAGQDINLYLADMHIGSTTVTESLYKENINYGVAEVRSRLENAIVELCKLGNFDNLNLVLLGDQVDCCGIFGKTASLTHDMPENMFPKDQANAYIETIIWFIDSIIHCGIASNIKVYSVPNGNHSGCFEYVCNKAIMAMINAKWPSIQTTLWDKFYGVFEQNEHTFVCCHGKMEAFQKKGFPLNLDDKSKILIYEWLDDNNIHGDNIHIIKGDLHSNNMNSCKRFTYRNVLSLYGASDYSNANYSRNSWGISYDLMVGNTLLSGTFENI